MEIQLLNTREHELYTIYPQHYLQAMISVFRKMDDIKQARFIYDFKTLNDVREK